MDATDHNAHASATASMGNYKYYNYVIIYLLSVYSCSAVTVFSMTKVLVICATNVQMQ